MTDATNSGPLTIAIYNPALLRKEDLIRGFVARQPLLERLLDDLRREGTANAPQHHLIIGQRGLGKTTLLRRLAFAVEDDAALAAVWMPLVFPEEQYNVASLADFWLNCVDALSDALDRAGDRAASQSLDARLEGVPASGPERSSAALRLLLDEAERLGRRVLLLVDNIDIVLDRLNRDEEWEFRRVISGEHRLHIIGASSRVLEALYEHGRAFYDFFQVHELKGFDETETFSTLCRLAEQSGNAEVAKLIREQPGRIKALRVLTGGNPRTLVLLFKVLAQGPEGDVQRDLEQLLDAHTALYKARFEELAPQAQQIVDAMAIHWDPLTAADLTEHLGTLGVNQISAQLKRLEDFGVVEKTPWFGEKKNAFQIAERFFNIWYLMRASRRVRRRLVWLARFLESWYDREELDARARGFLERDPKDLGRERYAEMALAYSQAVPDRYLRRNLESAGLRAVLDDPVRRMIDFSDLPEELQSKKERMEQLRDLRTTVLGLKINWVGTEPAEFWRVLGGSPHFSLMEKARIVEQLPSLERAALAEMYEKLELAEQRMQKVYRGQEADVAQLYEALAGGEMADAFDYENAIAVAKRRGLRSLPVIAISSRTSPSLTREQLSEAEMNQAESALRAMTAEPGFEARAWNGLGNLLSGRQGRYDAAEQAYHRAIKLDPLDAWPWNNIGNLLRERQRYEEAEQAYRRAIEMDPRYSTPWSNLGSLLRGLNRYEEAEQAYRRATEVDPRDSDAWAHFGNLLGELKRYEEAERAFRRAIEIDPWNYDLWFGLGCLLRELKRHEEAEQAYRRAVDLDPQAPEPWINLGNLLGKMKRYEEAEQAYRRSIELDSRDSAPWFGLGVLMWDLKRYTEAEQSYRRTIELDPLDARPWNNLGVVLEHLKRTEEAERAYRAAIDRDARNAHAWSNLAGMLQLSPATHQEAAEAALRAFEIDPTRSWDLARVIRIIDLLAESPDDLPAALTLAQRATELAPENPDAQFLLARVLALGRKWPDAAQVLKGLAGGESAGFSLGFFRAAVKAGHVNDVIEILERTGANERWRPLYEALRAVREGTPDYLRKVAPEVRVAAMGILRGLAPDLFPDERANHG